MDVACEGPWSSYDTIHVFSQLRNPLEGWRRLMEEAFLLHDCYYGSQNPLRVIKKIWD